MILNIWFTILLILVMVALIVALVCIAVGIIQIRKTARQAELVLQKVNNDLDVINKISGKVADITEKVSAPVISVFSAVFYIVSSLVKKK